MRQGSTIERAEGLRQWRWRLRLFRIAQANAPTLAMIGFYSSIGAAAGEMPVDELDGLIDHFRELVMDSRIFDGDRWHVVRDGGPDALRSLAVDLRLCAEWLATEPAELEADCLGLAASLQKWARDVNEFAAFEFKSELS